MASGFSQLTRALDSLQVISPSLMSNHIAHPSREVRTSEFAETPNTCRRIGESNACMHQCCKEGCRSSRGGNSPDYISKIPKCVWI